MSGDAQPGARTRRALAVVDDAFRRGLEPAPPSVFYLSLTEVCQLRCAHCITRAPERTADGSARHMSAAVLDALAPHLAHARYVGLTHAGEPLLSPAFSPLLDRLRAARGDEPYVVHLLTNGMALTEARFLDVVSRGVRSLSFSLDGMSEESNDRLREGGKVALLLPRIRALAAMRRDRALDVRMGISWTVTRSNVRELDEGVRFAADAGLEWIKIEEVFPLNARGEEERLPDDELARAAAYALEVARQAGVVLVDHTREHRVWRCDDDGLDAEMVAFARADDYANRLDINPCRLPWEVICVEPDGQVKPLSFHHGAAGNVLDVDLLELLRAPPFALARERAGAMRLCAGERPSCPAAELEPARP